MVECTTLLNLTMRGGRDVELQNPNVLPIIVTVEQAPSPKVIGASNKY